MSELLNFIDTAGDARELKRALAVKLTFEGYVHAEIIKILNVTSGFISNDRSRF
jgi:putative transposase